MLGSVCDCLATKRPCFSGDFSSLGPIASLNSDPSDYVWIFVALNLWDHVFLEYTGKESFAM